MTQQNIEQQLEKERRQLETANPFDLIHWSLLQVEILMDLKVEDWARHKKQKKLEKAIIYEERFKEEKDRTTVTPRSERERPDYSDSVRLMSPVLDTSRTKVAYEEMIQKLEGDVRAHLRVEQQMKIYSDSVTEELDSYRNRVSQLEKEQQAVYSQNEKMEKRLDEISG